MQGFGLVMNEPTKDSLSEENHRKLRVKMAEPLISGTLSSPQGSCIKRLIPEHLWDPWNSCFNTNGYEGLTAAVVMEFAFGFHPVYALVSCKPSGATLDGADYTISLHANGSGTSAASILSRYDQDGESYVLDQARSLGGPGSSSIILRSSLSKYGGPRPGDSINISASLELGGNSRAVSNVVKAHGV